MARPRKDPSQLRVKPMNVYPTDAEKAAIEAAAALRGMKVSPYVLACCVKEKTPPAKRTNRGVEMVHAVQDAARALTSIANNHAACCGPFERVNLLTALWSIDLRIAEMSGYGDRSDGPIDDEDETLGGADLEARVI